MSPGVRGPQRLPNLHFFLLPFRRLLNPKFFADFPVQAILISQIHTAADLRESLVVSLLLLPRLLPAAPGRSEVILAAERESRLECGYPSKPAQGDPRLLPRGNTVERTFPDSRCSGSRYGIRCDVSDRHERGTFPDYRARGSALEEERRSAFVAVTRSRRLLYITYPNTKVMPWGAVKAQQPSQYIAELFG
jgi:hypothetical protein